MFRFSMFRCPIQCTEPLRLLKKNETVSICFMEKMELYRTTNKLKCHSYLYILFMRLWSPSQFYFTTLSISRSTTIEIYMTSAREAPESLQYFSLSNCFKSGPRTYAMSPRFASRKLITIFRRSRKCKVKIIHCSKDMGISDLQFLL